MKTIYFYKQPDQMDCGSTCLRMIAKHYGKNFTLQRLREIRGINREGVSLLGISEAAEKIGFRTMGSRLKIEQLADLELPAILHWNQNHFVVLYRIRNGIYLNNTIEEQQAKFRQALNSMLNEAESWMMKYVVLSPLAGKVAYAGILQENQNVTTNQELFVVNSGNTNFFGEVQIP